MGGFPLVNEFSTVSLENTMSKMHQVTLPVTLFVSALFLSACASTPQEEVVKPAPVTTEAAAPAPVAAPAPEVAIEQPAPAVTAAAPAAKPVVKKAKKKVAKAAPKPAPVEPVAAPVVKEAPPVAAPAPVAQPAPAVVVTPLPKATPPGFLEQYWMWLLGIIIAIIAILWMKKKD
jgi:hypothetical protein